MGCQQTCLSHDNADTSKLFEVEEILKPSPRPIQEFSSKQNQKVRKIDLSDILKILISKHKLSEHVSSLLPKKSSKKSKRRKEKKRLSDIIEISELPNENEIEVYTYFSKAVHDQEIDTDEVQISQEIALPQDFLQLQDPEEKPVREKKKKSKKFNLGLDREVDLSAEHLSVASSATRSLLNNSVRSTRKLFTIDGKEIKVDLTMTPFNGEAKYKWPDNSVYEGQWKNNKMHGQGVLCWPDGRVYKGNFVYGIREGFGIMSWANGQVYEGYWRAGKQDGEGVLTIKGKSAPIVIRGTWVNGMRGKATYNNV